MSAVETGQMTAAETSVLSQQKKAQVQSWLTKVRPVQKHQIWPEMGRESTVWPETWSRSMPGPFRSLWDGSNPLQGAVSGLVLEVQVGSIMSVRAQIIENGLKWVENRPFGLKQRPNESYGLSGPIRTTPEAKNGQKTWFLKKTGPGGRPAAPSDAFPENGQYVCLQRSASMSAGQAKVASRLRGHVATRLRSHVAT